MVATTQKGGLTPQMIDRATVSAPVTSQELTYKDQQGFTTSTDRTHALAPLLQYRTPTLSPRERYPTSRRS